VAGLHSREHDASEDFQVEYHSIKVELLGILSGNEGIRERSLERIESASGPS
jgi:hypothetical protein